MIRTLAMIALAGFVLSVGTLSAAVAIGGPDAVARGGWSVFDGNFDGFNYGWDGHSWGWHGRHHREARRWHGDLGAETTRTIAWTGAEALDLDVSADVQYVQSDGPATLTVTGPANVVNDLEVHGDTVELDHEHGRFFYPKLKIVLKAPGVKRFDLSGDNTLAIENYRQDRLDLDVSGAAEVTAAGEAQELSVDISGSGNADLGKLRTKGAEVDISGAADVTVAPTDWARLDVSGMGDVKLLTRPGKLESNITGAGKVREAEGAPSAPAPPAPPSAPKKKT